MSENKISKGPFFHRFLVGLFSVLFGILVLWLLNFADRDLRSIKSPVYEDTEKTVLGEDLLKKEIRLKETSNEIKNHISIAKSQQSMLRDRADSLQKTINQILEVQKINQDKNIPLSENDQRALTENKNQFLQTQKEYDQMNTKVAELSANLDTQSNELEIIRKTREDKKKTLQEEFETRIKNHNLKVGFYRISFLIPWLAAAAFLFIKGRNSNFAVMIYSFGIAVFLKILFVLNEYCPKEYYKYILLFLAIIVVLKVLLTLIKMTSAPQRDWLLKQYREAYEKFLCPVCNFPIRRGPLKYMYWNQRSLKRLSTGMDNLRDMPEEKYICPSCGTALFEECGSCHAIRYALLPSCDKCGNKKEI